MSLVITKLVCSSFFAALLITIYVGLRRSLPPLVSLAATALVGTIPSLTGWSSTAYADTTVTLYWTASVLYLFHWLRAGAARDLPVAAALAALAVWAKHEGLLYWILQAGVVGVAVIRAGVGGCAARSLSAFAGISAVVLVPWLFVLHQLHLQSYDFVTVSEATTLAGLDRLPIIAVSVASELANPRHWVLLWLVFLLGLALLIRTPGTAWWPHVYLAWSVLVPIAAFSASYVYSAWQPFTDHLYNSIERLVLQQAPIATLFISVQFHNWLFGWWQGRSEPQTDVGETAGRPGALSL